MSKPFNDLRKKMSPAAQARAELLTYDLLIGLGKPASKTADWIVDTYMPNSPVSHRLSIEHAIQQAIIEATQLPELQSILNATLSEGERG